jgi:citronellol/citronellal dehydrogenase
MGSHSSRRAVVTGASRGIGAAVAERLAAEGADVALVARTLDKHDHLDGSLSETADRIGAYGTNIAVIVADIGDADQRSAIIPQAVERLGGPIEILVNNAGAGIYQRMADYPLKRRRLTFEINVHAPLDLAQAVIPSMTAAGEGWIVNVSSATARHAVGPPFRVTSVTPTIGIYGASKAALNRETNALALELYGTGIRVNTVEPRSAVMSPGAEALVGGVVGDDQIESMEEMVESIVYLCSCDTDHTGHSYVSLDLLEQHGLIAKNLDGTPHRPS